MKYYSYLGHEITETDYQFYLADDGLLFFRWGSTNNWVYFLRYIGTSQNMWEFTRISKATGQPTSYNYSHSAVPDLYAAEAAFLPWWMGESITAPSIYFPGDLPQTQTNLVNIDLAAPEPKEHLKYLCPLCNGPMTKRNGKYGKFYSCQSWPRTKCPGTRNADGKVSKKILAMKKKEKKEEPKKNEDVVAAAIDMLDL